jgi:hypothetical protein
MMLILHTLFYAVLGFIRRLLEELTPSTEYAYTI